MNLFRKVVVGLALVATVVRWGGEPAPPTAPTQRVTDNVGVLSARKKADLEARLAAFEKATSNQFVVWIGTSTNEVPLESCTNDAFKAWKIGQKDKNNGLALFFFKGDNRLCGAVIVKIFDEPSR